MVSECRRCRIRQRALQSGRHGSALSEDLSVSQVGTSGGTIACSEGDLVSTLAKADVVNTSVSVDYVSAATTEDGFSTCRAGDGVSTLVTVELDVANNFGSSGDSGNVNSVSLRTTANGCVLNQSVASGGEGVCTLLTIEEERLAGSVVADLSANAQSISIRATHN